jgi:thioesterase domain-containing protein
MRTLGFREQLAYFMEKAAALRRTVARAIGWSVGERSTHDLPDEVLEIIAINQNARMRYQPRPYPGRLVLFRAERTPSWVGTRFEDPLLGWGSLATKGIEVHSVPSDHWTVLHRENVPPLARALNNYLRE